MSEPYPSGTQWTFETVQYGNSRTTELTLYWEAYGDPISDDYTTDEISATDLFHLWTLRLENGQWDEEIGDGWVSIFWTIRGQATFEHAPFDPMHPALRLGIEAEDFLTFFTWPTRDSGEEVNWLRLPVVDKLWRPEAEITKGGFIQEATGWKPGPYQPYAHVPTLMRAAGI